MTTGLKENNVPEEVQTLIQKHKRMSFFITQYEEELELLDKVREACSDLVTHKEKARHLSLYGPGQPTQIQLKIDLNEWTNAQNNAMAKQDIVEVIVHDYKRQKEAYAREIMKRGYEVPDSNGNGGAKTAALSIRTERSPVESTQTL